MSVTIFTMTHKKFPAPKDATYVPLQVGRACGEDLGYMGDDTGVSISDKNCFYGELTGVYWVWKNMQTSGYVGVCHYRRYFCTEEGRILTGTEYEKILSEYDIITSRKLKLNDSYFDGYASDYNIMDLIATGEVIRQYYPGYYEAFERLVHGRGTYFGNMMVCSKALYDEYCEWLFGIFEKAESRIDASGYDDYHKRVYGFISEFLLMVWIQVKGLRVYECKVGMTDEKRETAEMKEQLAGYFARKDIAGAKAYLLACLEKRPDVLMEASDITGELKLSMQVIAICELEQREYGGSLIERIQDFGGLMRYVQKLNDVIYEVRDGGVPLGKGKETEAFLRDASVTDIALEASARLFCSPEEARNAAHMIRNEIQRLQQGDIPE
ncbi:MAG: DUF4422 domain-containing protein [Clostridiales bacterium]|nr:DUF4422 domain-containing protein [Clostridiales bacterium]